MNKSLTITIPNYRAKSRNQTATRHWRAYQQARDEVLEFVKAYAKIVRFTVPVVVTIIAAFKGKRPIDTSNIDDKIFIDALMNIGIIEDDDPAHNPIVTKIVVTGALEDCVMIGVETADLDKYSLIM